MPDIVLIEPEHPGNIGAVARVMKNFGFSDLVLIDSDKKIITDETRCRAKHAQDVLKNIRFENKEALGRYDLVIGTTARQGSDYNLPRVPITPADAARMIDERKIALVFGREGKGLFNDEIRMCDLIVTIPTSRIYPALNLSHCVAVILYEISKNTIRPRKVEIAGRKYLDNIMAQLDMIFEKLDFTDRSKIETQQKAWKRIIAKSNLSKREAFAIFGFLKKLDAGLSDRKKKYDR